jgi:hypothetical protein
VRPHFSNHLLANSYGKPLLVPITHPGPKSDTQSDTAKEPRRVASTEPAVGTDHGPACSRFVRAGDAEDARQAAAQGNDRPAHDIIRKARDRSARRRFRYCRATHTASASPGSRPTGLPVRKPPVGRCLTGILLPWPVTPATGCSPCPLPRTPAGTPPAGPGRTPGCR